MLQSKKPMKHKLATIISIVAIVVLGLYASHLHNLTITQENRASSAAHSLQLKLDQEAANKQAQFQSILSLDEAQCTRDKIAYNTLTPVEKFKTVAPDCED